jgi:hypothetical protein
MFRMFQSEDEDEEGRVIVIEFIEPRIGWIEDCNSR